MEQWKSIIGYEGLYEVSTTGKVRSLRTGRPLRAGCNEQRGGRQVVTLWKNGASKNKYISRLVAHAFISNPSRKPLVDHIDRNPRNNHVSNLRWATISENGANSRQRRERALPRGVRRIVVPRLKAIRYQAYARQDRRQKHLGAFATVRAAQRAVDEFNRAKWGAYYLPSKNVRRCKHKHVVGSNNL